MYRSLFGQRVVEIIELDQGSHWCFRSRTCEPILILEDGFDCSLVGEIDKSGPPVEGAQIDGADA